MPTASSSRGALRKLARHFADPRVGCVCGELHYLSGDDNLVAKGYNVYWRYDQRLKRLESRLGLPARRQRVDLRHPEGAVPAAARLHPERHGRADPDRRPRLRRSCTTRRPCRGRPGSQDAPEELARRSRIIGRGILGVRAVLPDVLRSGRPLLLWELVSRKLLRYCTPFFFAGLLRIEPVPVEGPLRVDARGPGRLLRRRPPRLRAPARGGLRSARCRSRLYFVLGNLATALGWWKVLTGRELTRWETADRTFDTRIGSSDMPQAARR